jgi:hypothetical protein
LNIPSTEIWSLGSIDITMNVIFYYFEVGAIKNDTAEILCNQLKEMTDTVEQWAEAGNKDNNTEYNLYLGATIPENSLMIIRQNELKSTTIDLFNNISTTNESFCGESEKWMTNMIAKSIPLSGVSARERMAFFHIMKDKLNSLMKKIK